MLNSSFVSYLFCRQSHGDTVQPILYAFFITPGKENNAIGTVCSFIYLFIYSFVCTQNKSKNADRLG